MSSFGGKVLTGSVLAVIGLVTVKVVVAVVTGLVAFVSFLVFTVLPIVLVGWLIMKFLGRGRDSEKPAFE